MNITHLRERLQIQSRSFRPDALGGYANTWASGGEIWASVTPMDTGADSLDESKDLAPPRYRLRWRVGTKVPATARFQWRGETLRLLTSPKEDVYRRFVTAIVQGEGCHE